MITVVVPVSVIPSHPDTHVLEETLDSVRFHLPDAELLVTFDGVRAEQSERQADYDEFTRRALWLLDKKYRCAAPYLFDTHQHQSGMLRAVLEEIRTPLLMYVEADCPLVTDEPIDWELAQAYILKGISNLVRFHHETHILDAHQHMVHGMEGAEEGNPFFGFYRTSQWSQRPHLASTAYYRRIMESYFSPDSKAFIEERMHGVADEAFRVDGMAGWRQHLLHIYNHPGDSIKRSYTTDGRAGEKKFDGEQVF